MDKAIIKHESEAWDRYMRIRGLVKRETSFDLFESPFFLEHMLCELVGARKTKGKMNPVDGIMADGRRVEVKTSRPTISNGYVRYRFVKLGAKKKNADIYIFACVNEDRMELYIADGASVRNSGLKEISINAGIRLRRKWLIKTSSIHIVEDINNMPKQQTIEW